MSMSSPGSYHPLLFCFGDIDSNSDRREEVLLPRPPPEHPATAFERDEGTLELNSLIED